MGDAASLEPSVTGALLAQEIERAHEDAPAVGHDAHEACANCGAIRCGPYCHQCGQSGHVHTHAGALVHDLAHGVFHFEGKIWGTLPLLAWRPGELTRRYIEGERAKFVSPVALFLFSVFLMFAVVSNLAGHGGGESAARAHDAVGPLTAGQAEHLADLRRQRARATDPAARAHIDAEIAGQQRAIALFERPAPTADNSGDGTQIKAMVEQVHTDWGWLDFALRRAAANPDLLLYKMKSYGYKYSWALIPISVPFIWLLFAWRRDVGIYHHAIFSVYSLSFMSMLVVVLTVLGVVGVPNDWLFLAAAVIGPVHMYRQLKDTYRLGRISAAWRTVALIGITFVASLMFLLFLFYLGTD